MIYERNALENHLNSMAENNWHIDKQRLNYVGFNLLCSCLK